MENTESNQESGAQNSGVVHGVPGPYVSNVGILDLRSSTADDLGILRTIHNVGTVLLPVGLSGALKGVDCQNIGSTMEAEPGEKVLVGPSVEFDFDAMDAMDDDQALIIVGILFIADSVTPEQVSKKFKQVKLTGILIAGSGVRGALTSKLQHIGPALTLPAGCKSCIKEVGSRVVTPGYLKHISDKSAFINIGETTFELGVSLEAVEQKIAAYVNLGVTQATRDVLDYLEAKCAANLGVFEELSKA